MQSNGNTTLKYISKKGDKMIDIEKILTKTTNDFIEYLVENRDHTYEFITDLRVLTEWVYNYDEEPEEIEPSTLAQEIVETAIRLYGPEAEALSVVERAKLKEIELPITLGCINEAMSPHDRIILGLILIDHLQQQ